MRRLELVAMSIVLLGLPLAFGLPRTMMGKLYALISVPIVAFAAAVAVHYLGKRSAASDQGGAARADPWDLPLDSAFPAPWRHVDASAGAIDKSQWTLELLQRLEWRRFEEVCAGYFEASGFRAEMTAPGADDRSHLRLYANGATTPVVVVQCKGWNVHSVGINPMRDLVEAMSAQKTGKAVFVTCATFTPEAQALAAKQKIHLIEGADLLAKTLALAPAKSAALLKLATEGDFLTPTCPSCGVKMAPRTSMESARRYWGCVNEPRCNRSFFGGPAVTIRALS